MNGHKLLEQFEIEYKSFGKNSVWKSTDKDISHPLLKGVPLESRVEFCNNLYETVREIRFNYADYSQSGISETNLNSELHGLLNKIEKSYQKVLSEKTTPHDSSFYEDETVGFQYDDTQKCWFRSYREYDLPHILFHEMVKGELK
jgi:hypothetical protein